jgi:hypothetical protein
LHDNIKDRALLVNDVPILRLKTNESNEDIRIVEAINKALSIGEN